MNPTSSLVLGETYGAWAIALLGLLATAALGGAAVWAARKANQIATGAIEAQRRLAQESFTEQRRALAEARRQDRLDSMEREIDELLRTMARLSSSTPIDPRPPWRIKSQYSETYERLARALASVREYGACMLRVHALDRQLHEAGRPTNPAEPLFREFHISEHEEWTEELLRIVEGLGQAIADNQAVDDADGIQARLERLRNYWEKRWFNLPEPKPLRSLDPLSAGLMAGRHGSPADDRR